MWDDMLMELVALVVDCCGVREEPAWGLVNVFEVVPGRRRGLMELEPSPQASDGCEVLRWLGWADKGELISLPPGSSSS
jgi:hypothetical protein